MQIYIHNNALDMPHQDAGMSFEAMLFSDVLADAFSTDVELPLSARNILLLDVWGLQDRGVQLFGALIDCTVIFANVTYDSRLRVSKITDNTITVSVFFSALPDIVGEQLNRLIVDDSTTIKRWVDYSMELTPSTDDVNFSFYNYGIEPQSLNSVPYHPNIKVNALLSRIATARNITLPSVDPLIRIVSTKQTVCPQNPYMLVMLPRKTDGTHTNVEIEERGLHVCIESEGKYALKCAKSCSATITFFETGDYGSIGTFTIKRTRNGNTYNLLTHNYTIPVSPNMPYDSTSGIISCQKDDLLSFDFRVSGSSAGVQPLMFFEFASYSIAEQDYGMDMPYIKTTFPSLLQQVVTNAAFNYFGAICNLPDVSVREFITSLAWHMGYGIKTEGRDVSFVAANSTKEIEAQLLSLSPITDKVGQLSTFEDAAGKVYHSFNINNVHLTETVTVFKSVFAWLENKRNPIGTLLYIPENTWGDSANDVPTAQFSAIEGMAICKFLTGMGYLVAWEDIGLPLLFNIITSVMEAEFVTREDIRGYNYIIVNGHRYMVIEGDVDETSGLTTWKGLLI